MGKSLVDKLGSVEENSKNRNVYDSLKDKIYDVGRSAVKYSGRTLALGALAFGVAGYNNSAKGDIAVNDCYDLMNLGEVIYAEPGNSVPPEGVMEWDEGSQSYVSIYDPIHLCLTNNEGEVIGNLINPFVNPRVIDGRYVYQTWIGGVPTPLMGLGEKPAGVFGFKDRDQDGNLGTLVWNGSRYDFSIDDCSAELDISECFYEPKDLWIDSCIGTCEHIFVRGDEGGFEGFPALTLSGDDLVFPEIKIHEVPEPSFTYQTVFGLAGLAGLYFFKNRNNKKYINRG